jgi:hypothetical protein
MLHTPLNAQPTEAINRERELLDSLRVTLARLVNRESGCPIKAFGHDD